MKKILVFLATISIFSSAQAAIPKNWDILPSHSKIEFFAKQGDTEISGSFQKFSGLISFNPKDLVSSKIVVDIDVISLDTSLQNATELLSQKEWFNFAKYPKAKFTSQKIAALPENKYRCSGLLKIKGKEVPVTFDFAFEEYEKDEARALGTLTIKRTDFDIGAADEKAAEGVKDDVLIKFSVTAIPHDLKIGI